LSNAEWVALTSVDPNVTLSAVGLTKVHGPSVACVPSFSVPALSTVTPVVATGSMPFGAGNGVMLEFSTTQFSSFFVSEAGAVLPINLKSFTANDNGAQNEIKWETSLEVNLRNFVVEKSKDSKVWTKVGDVSPDVSKRYQLNDANPYSTTYYRLRSIDKDGQEDVSKVVVVNRKTGKFTITSIAPNPTSENLSVKFETTENTEVTINVLDIFGKVVLTQKVNTVSGFNSSNVETSQIPSGSYFLNINDGINTVTQRIIKQ
jgi:Secretion system C-terminal sorting domain